MYEQLTNIVTATALSPPSGTHYAMVSAEGDNCRYTADGATNPTPSLGMILYAGAAPVKFNALELANLKIIGVSDASIANVEYY